MSETGREKESDRQNLDGRGREMASEMGREKEIDRQNLDGREGGRGFVKRGRKRGVTDRTFMAVRVEDDERQEKQEKREVKEGGKDGVGVMLIEI